MADPALLGGSAYANYLSFMGYHGDHADYASARDFGSLGYIAEEAGDGARHQNVWRKRWSA